MRGAVVNCEALLVHTLVILSETGECYEMFADQLKVANNSETAELFDELAEVQHKRTGNLEKMMEGLERPHISPWDFTWDADHSPEIPTVNAAVHYLMTPHQVLSLAVNVEQWAIEFFTWVAECNSNGKGDDALRQLARQFSYDAEKFRKQLLRRQESFPPPEEGWDHDPDPPLIQE